MKTIINMTHFILNFVLAGFILLGIGISFLIMTDSHKSPVISAELESSYDNENIRNPQFNPVKGDPTKWVILSVSNDYSTAKVLKEDGNVYYMTVYSASDIAVDIVVNGSIHEFYYTK